ncbi:MAG: response regulator transcription factor [Firmicutes bacterium]|nr:response regulator transcription factor [Bacillota bacterium]
MIKILIAEDDDSIRKLISKYLSSENFEVVESENGKKALTFFETQHFDIVITDVLMPLLDGNELTTSIRKINIEIPILMLTALESFSDKEKGFLSGTDDYLVKPIEMKELLLRIKALLRRSKIASENKIEYKNILLDLKSNVALIGNERVELTKKEFLLLYKLISYPNIIFTRNQLMDEIWGYDSESYDRTIDTHIKRIREKIKSEDLEIITVRGLGYKVILK